MVDTFRPALERSAKGAGVVRLKNGGRLDFWTLGNAISGRGRRYHRIVIDEAAFAKAGDNMQPDSMMSIWEKAIKPTLLDFNGEALICSNTNGKDPDNFFYNICTEPKYGFKEYHATTLDNPLLPKPLPGESKSKWLARRAQVLELLKKENDPLVYAQEYLAEFVEWSGVAFFAREKLLLNGQPVAYPRFCDSVFAVSCLVVKAVGTDVAAAATDLMKSITPAKIEEWTHSDPTDWANESFAIAERAQTKYCVQHGASCDLPDPAKVKIDAAYVEANTPIVREQLQKAGVRLAHLLDSTLGK